MEETVLLATGYELAAEYKGGEIVTKKFCKEWNCVFDDRERQFIQSMLDGGGSIIRVGCVVAIEGVPFVRNTPGEAVKFASALNRLRHPLRRSKTKRAKSK